MIKLMDKLKSNFRVNKKVFMFLISILIIGVLFGSIYTTILKDEDKLSVINEVESFISNVENINYLTSIKNVLITCISTILIIWILGISVIGIPISLIIFFTKSFILGFSISSFIITYGVKGTLLSFIYIFPCQITNIMITIYILTYSLIMSFKILESVIKKRTFDFKLVMNKYKKVLFISIIIVLISCIYEIFIMPNIIKLILPLIK